MNYVPAILDGGCAIGDGRIFLSHPLPTPEDGIRYEILTRIGEKRSLPKTDESVPLNSLCSSYV